MVRAVDALAELAGTLVRDPAAAARDAIAVASAARTAGDHAVASRAEMIRGRAMLLLGEIAIAEQALAAAIDAARTAAEPELEAEALLPLAAVHSAAGRHDDAFAALDTVARLGSPALVERSVLQRGVVCRDARRYDEALALFRSAEDGLRGAGRDLDLARVLANTGGILTHQGRIDEAIAALTEAIELLRRDGHDFVALQVVHDLGCAEGYRGNLVEALALFDEAEQGMAALGHDASFPVLSRSEALLRAGLTGDALAVASEAARRLTAEGHAFGALALLTAAEAARLDGDPERALQYAERATDDFGAGGTSGWQRAAHLEAIRCRLQLQRLSPISLETLGQLVEATVAAGDLRTQVEARCLHAVVAAELGTPDLGSAHLAAAGRLARRHGLAQLDTQVGVATAHHAAARGDVAGARRGLRRAFDAVNLTKHLYGGGESNPGLGAGGRATADAAMRVAAAERSPLRRLDWMERVRSLALTSVRPSERPVDFAALRATTAELRHAERDGEPTEELRRRQAHLEAQIREHWLRDRRELGAADALPDLRELRGAVGDREIVSIGFASDRTVAVVVGRRGARSVDLAPPPALAAVVDRATAAHRGLSVGGVPAIVASRRRVYTTALAELDALVLAPLRLRGDDVVLVLPPRLVAAPWAATRTLGPRRFSIAPSVAWWLRVVNTPTEPSGTTLVVAGPRLAYAHDEAAGVAACHPGATLLAAADATVGPTIEALGSHDLAHIVAHGRFRHDNPLWSTIDLTDGPLSVYELQQLERVPRTIVIATCESAAVGGRAGAELQGLSASLLALGARTVVASAGLLPDDVTTRDTMVRMHRDLRAGLGAAESLALARASTLPDLDLTAAALLTIGIGA